MTKIYKYRGCVRRNAPSLKVKYNPSFVSAMNRYLGKTLIFEKEKDNVFYNADNFSWAEEWLKLDPTPLESDDS